MDPDPDISDPDQKNWNRIWQKGPGSETQHERQCCGAGTCLGGSGSRSWSLEPTPVPTTPAPGKKGRSRRLRLHKLKFLSFWAIKKSIIITSLFWNIFTFGNYSSVPVTFDTSTRLFFFDCLEDVTRAAFSALTNKKIGSSSTLKAATPDGSGSATLIKDSKFWTHIFLDNNPTEHLIIS